MHNNMVDFLLGLFGRSRTLILAKDWGMQEVGEGNECFMTVSRDDGVSLELVEMVEMRLSVDQNNTIVAGQFLSKE